MIFRKLLQLRPCLVGALFAMLLIVFSDDEVAVRGYTLFGGQPTLVPIAVYK